MIQDTRPLSRTRPLSFIKLILFFVRYAHIENEKLPFNESGFSKYSCIYGLFILVLQLLTSFLIRVVLDGPGVAAVGVVRLVEGAAAVVDVVAFELPGDAIAALATAREAVPLAAVPLGVGAHRDPADLRPHCLEALRTHRLRRHQKSVGGEGHCGCSIRQVNFESFQRLTIAS